MRSQLEKMPYVVRFDESGLDAALVMLALYTHEAPAVLGHLSMGQKIQEALRLLGIIDESTETWGKFVQLKNRVVTAFGAVETWVILEPTQWLVEHLKALPTRVHTPEV